MAAVINEAQFASEVLQSDKPVLVDFYADWCGPCKVIEPMIEELSNEMADKAKVVKINVDENQNLANQYGVMSIPALVFFKGGQVVHQLLGGQSKDTLSAKLNELAA